MAIPLPSSIDTLAPLTEALDAVDHGGRMGWLEGLAPKELHRLWELAEGHAVGVDHYVYADEPTRPRIHEGLNTIPLSPMRRFQKRFVACSGTVSGYNHPLGLLNWVVWFQGFGPFCLVPSETTPGEVWVDYRRVPPQHSDYPLVQVNRWGRWAVYGGMIDVMRRVSADVTIGVSLTKSFPLGIGEKFALVRCP